MFHELILTCSTEQNSSWEANRFSASQEIRRINPKVHYRIHKCPPPARILSQLDPVHTSTSHFLKFHLKIIFTSMPGPPQWSLSLRFSHQNPLHASPLPHTCYMPHPSPSWFYETQNFRYGFHRNILHEIFIYIQQNVTLRSLFISVNCSTCFGWYLHSSSGAHTTVSTASDTCQTVTATCHYCGRGGTRRCR